MDTSIRVARGMMRGWKGRGPRGAIGDMDSRSTSGPDPAAGDIRIVTITCLRRVKIMYSKLHTDVRAPVTLCVNAERGESEMAICKLESRSEMGRWVK